MTFSKYNAHTQPLFQKLSLLNINSTTRDKQIHAQNLFE